MNLSVTVSPIRSLRFTPLPLIFRAPCPKLALESDFDQGRQIGQKVGQTSIRTTKTGKDTRMNLKLDPEVDRRGFLKCMQWAGAAVVWSFTSGVPSSQLLAQNGRNKDNETADFTFVQIS